MTGGMDNPVDVAFTPAGRADSAPQPSSSIRSRAGATAWCTPSTAACTESRTPSSTATSAPAISCRSCPSSDLPFRPGSRATRRRAFGDGFRDNFFAAMFNLRKVTRHVLEPSGATFTRPRFRFPRLGRSRLPSDRRDRRRRRQPARDRHRRLVQALLPDLAARQAGRARRDLPRPPHRRTEGAGPARPSIWHGRR